MFHIKVSYTSSFSARFFRSPTPPFTRFRAYTRTRQPIAREPRLTSSILARLFFFYSTFRDESVAGSERGGKCETASWSGSWTETSNRHWSTIVSLFFFFCTEKQEMKKAVWKDFSFVIQVKIVFVCFSAPRNVLQSDCCVYMRAFWVWKSITRDLRRRKKK